MNFDRHSDGCPCLNCLTVKETQQELIDRKVSRSTRYIPSNFSSVCIDLTKIVLSVNFRIDTWVLHLQITVAISPEGETCST
jgi:hypothetical protein